MALFGLSILAATASLFPSAGPLVAVGGVLLLPPHPSLEGLPGDRPHVITVRLDPDGDLTCAGGTTIATRNPRVEFTGCAAWKPGKHYQYVFEIDGVSMQAGPRFGVVRDANRSGELTVTTDPALPADLFVNGKAFGRWHLDAIRLPPGLHVVSFGSIDGWVRPEAVQVRVREGQETHLTGKYVRAGSLRVTTEPPVPSTISVDGVPSSDWGLWRQALPGTYEVCFGPVASHQPPPCQTARVLGGELTLVTGVFLEEPGEPGPPASTGILRVAIEPALPVAVFIDGAHRNDSGIDAITLSAGIYVVSFGDAPGFTTPPPQVVSLRAGDKVGVTGHYRSNSTD